ncbi:MAG: fructokinase [Actinomycetia bacterium]|nr:fructokinase [Actinomycetes bacterium]
MAEAQTHSVVSAGFTAVDLMLGDSMTMTPGGTATNVCQALGSMGWMARLVGTVGSDPAGSFLREELEREAVNVDHLLLDEDWTTPIVLQERQGNDHVWRFRCPHCNTRYAKSRPAPVAAAQVLLDAIPTPDVFFFDRTSLFSLRLATHWAELGSFVVFEPAGLGRPHLFAQALRVAHLVKYSSERAPAFRAYLEDTTAALVDTNGAAGVRFRAADREDWFEAPAYSANAVVDTAGAGDWTTAGIVRSLVSDDGRSPVESVGDVGRLRAAVDAGQQLGVLACTWRGVRPTAPAELPIEQLVTFSCPLGVRAAM